jgi:arylsulfatase A-like enzyme
MRSNKSGSYEPFVKIIIVYLPFLLMHTIFLGGLYVGRSSQSALSILDISGLMAFELTLLGITLWVLGIFGVQIKRGVADSSIGRIIYSVFVPAAIVILLFIYWSSWALFRSTQKFLDIDGIQFFQTNSVQLLQHVVHLEPDSALIVPLLAVMSTLVILFLPSQILHRVPQWLQKKMVMHSAMLFIFLAYLGTLSVVLPKSTGPIVDRNAGTVYSYDDLVSMTRTDKAGPLSHLVLDTLATVGQGSADIVADNTIGIEWKTIVPMDSYVSTVNNSAFKKKNVLLIMVESLRNDQLTLLGGTRQVMPNVEALARKSWVFANNYSQASHSNYSDPCPLSSHYPLRSPAPHVYPVNPPYPRVLIYDVLKTLGYRTSIFSSQNEHWGAMLNYLDTGNLDKIVHSQTYNGPTYVPLEDIGFAQFASNNKRSGKIDDRFTVNEALKWISEEPTLPFFIYMNLQNSHIPYTTPSDFPRKFGPKKSPFQIGFGSFPSDPHSVSIVKNMYADSLAYIDFQIGRLLEGIKTLGLENNTVVIITGDNGQAFYEHGFAAHASKLYDEAVNVPLIIFDPDRNSRLDNQPSQHIDIPPTVFSLLGLPPHPSFQGRDLSISGNVEDHALYLVAQSPLAHEYAIVQSGYKLMYDARNKISILYDLREDPAEKFDQSMAVPEVKTRLKKRLDSWRRMQLDYYQKATLHKRWYPPVLLD